MIVDHELGLTILSRCGLPPVRLVVENTRSYEWESLPRREPRRARERLGPLKPRGRASSEQTPSTASSQAVAFASQDTGPGNASNKIAYTPTAAE